MPAKWQNVSIHFGFPSPNSPATNSVITSDQAKLVDLVQLLGEFLVDDENETRRSAIQCIADTLKSLPADKLTKQQLTVVVEFLSERLADEPVTAQVLDAMAAVVAMTAISSLGIKNIIESIVKYYVPSKHVQVVRYKAYQLLHYLTQHKAQSLRSTPAAQEAFIKCFLTATSGEKDPRNLLESFQINTWIHQNLKVPEKHVEELFDATFCYFPITFRPPKNDPYKITAEDLKLALRNALSSGKDFEKLVFPALLEKLTSSSLSVKGDTLDTIASCLTGYGPDITAKHWKEVWDGTKFEVLHGSEPELAAKTLTVLKRLAEQLSKYGDQSQLEDYLKEVKKDCMEKLNDPTNRLSQQAAQIIASVSLASTEVAQVLTPPALAAVLAACNEAPLPTLTAGCEVVVIFLRGVPSEVAPDPDHPLFEFKDRIFDLLAKALLSSPESESALRILAIRGFSAAVKIPEYLSSNDTELIVRYLDDVVVSDSSTKTLEAAVDALVLIAGIPTNATTIQQVAFPALLSELPALDSTKENKARILFILSVLAKMSQSKSLIEMLQVRLLGKVDEVVGNGSTELYPILLLQTLLTALREQETNDSKFDSSPYLKSTFPRLFGRTFNASYSGDSILGAPQVTEAAGRVMTCIIRQVPQNKQEPILTALFSFFFNGSPSELFPGTVDPKKPLNILDKPIPAMALLTACTAPLNKDLSIPKLQDPFVLLRSVVATVSESTSSQERRNYLRFAGLLANKWVDPKVAPQAVAFVSELFTQSAASLEAACWIIKGWLLKADNAAFKFVDQLVEMLHGSNGTAAARSFDILLGDDELFTKANGLVVRLLFKQRLFSTVVPKLVDGFNNASSASVKVNYVVALSNIVNSIPSSIVSPALQDIITLVVDSLSVDDSRVKTAGIDTILATIGESPETIAAYLDSLVPSLLNVCAESPAPVKIKALNCLGAFATAVDLPKIVPFKNRIISALTVLLDHPKRDVRRATVDTRQAYFELGITKS